MLQLEYTCTNAELREARSLNAQQQLGKGSPARTLLVLFGILAVLLALAYFQIREMVAPRFQPLALASIVVLFFFFYFKLRRARKRSRKPAKVELTEREVTFVNDGLRISTLWSGFSECLESPNLFVLLDRTKGLLLVFPKRVFPDEKAQNWFRARANQRPGVAASTADTPFSPDAPVTTDGIVLNFQLGYRDYLNRTVTSWRMRGFVLALYLAVTGMFLYTLAHPAPDAVNSPVKVFFVFLLPVFTAMLAAMILGIGFFFWRSHIKYLVPRRMVLGNEQIEFATANDRAVIPWTTYKYYLENRWSFFVWDPRGQQWDMYPKRAFTSAAERERCRALLQQRLRPSRWFFL